MAELIINLSKLRSNLQYIQKICNSKKLELIGVVKGCFAFQPIIECFCREGLTSLGMSKVSVVEDIAAQLPHRPFLVALPAISQAQEITRLFKTSLNSEILTIRALADAANQNRVNHEIVLMVDTGDLREGLMPDRVLRQVRQILKIKSDYLKFAGIGANLACCCGTLPSHDNLAILQDLAEEIEASFAVEVKTVSVGGSVMLDWLQIHDLPPKISQIRIGESIFLGNLPAVNRPHPSLFTDVMTLKGEVLEIQEKPSVPDSHTGRDCLGNVPELVDKGLRKRAILNFGVVDTEPGGLTARIENIEKINSCSEYTIYDVTDCLKHLQAGDVIEFDLNYHAMIQSFLSPHTKIHVIDA